MKSKTKSYLILILSLITILVLVSVNWFSLRKRYMVVFQKTGIVGHHNSEGELDGELDLYINGDIVRTAHYKDGVFDGLKITYYTNGVIKTKSFYKKGNVEGFELNYYEDENIKSKESYKAGDREGPETFYYENGQIERMLTYKNDKAEGLENAYYKDGKLMYTRNWVNDRPFGDFYYYDDNARKKVLFYHAYDILGVKFYVNRYDESRTDGFAFSSNIYSKYKDSVIILKNNKSYESIKDLYVTIANPDSVSTQIQMFINNKSYKDWDQIDNSTIKASNVFLKKGIYDLVVKGRFIDKPDMITTLKLKVIKE